MSRAGEAHDSEIGIVVVGAQKAFSTTLAAALGEHPDVEMAPGEFHGFLNAPYAAGAASRIHGAFTDEAAAIKGFKCASYLADPAVPRRLYDDLGAPHIVAALRNPVRRAESAWYWLIRTGLLPAVPAEEGLRPLLEQAHHGVTSASATGEVIAGPRWRHAHEVLEWGLYDRHLATYEQVFPSERLHVVTDLELAADPDAALARLAEELGLSPFTPTLHRHRANQGVYSMSRLRWLRLRQRFVWHRDADGVWTQGRPAQWWKWLLNAAVVGTDRVVLSRALPNVAPPLSERTRGMLVDYYTDDVRRLERRLNRDLSPWLS